ncbi:MAG: EFR1 family ferrodoxin [Candidatus Lokiarchaeota archaeon]|nr:EFR1 family ferrodoxin [Candidatus Lokiarchaeota archaeon]
MKTEIYYFSGTGNSLYLAKQLQSLLPEINLIPIAKILRFNYIETKGENIGFIFPCHGLTIPIPVRKLLKRINIKASKYFFAIVTRGGSIFRGFPKINKLLKKQGKKLNASFVITMGLNDPKLKAFKVPNKRELKAIEINVQEKLRLIENVINHQKNYHDDNSGVRFSKFSIVNLIMERLIPFAVHYIAPKVKQYFYIDSKCMSCGICEKVCPSQKIIMKNNQPIWQSIVNCYYCYACLNYCPTESIQIYSQFYMKSYTPERGRYPHPYANVKEISNQK